MAQFCHPEFGCDCSEDKPAWMPDLSPEEWRAILNACEQVNDEYGLLVGAHRNPAEYIAASDRGTTLLMKLREMVGSI